MISIVIPSYNGKKFLEGCLRSIYLQKYKDYEIIVVDNASEDGTEEWVQKQDRAIKYINLEQNYGFSKAVNEGIKQAKGEYVLLLNNDTELNEGFLENIVQPMKKDLKIFAVSSKMIQYNNRKLVDDAGDEYTVIGWAEKRGDSQDISRYVERKQIFSACAGAALYRKAIFNEIGYFDEEFFAYLEDIDISYRANIFGYKCIYEPSAIVYHIGSATSGGGNSDFKIKLSGRNNVYVLYKNMPLIQLIINMPFLVIGHFGKKWIFRRKGYEQAYIEGVREGILTRHRIKKVPFYWRNTWNYIRIEFKLIMNTFIYVVWKKCKKIKHDS